ncbi:immunity protein Imm33 domain-containing protein [Dactylosporangium sp. CA-139066]|uniref:immunity protein Imm33 domain-containing protein n=1 Tax=Dactylosporangium sp. CA-139066 TaxID=3239930 RepID=UPI003D905AE1
MWWGRGRAGVRRAQRSLCERFAAAPQFVTGPEMLGASASLMQPGIWPIRGLRHQAEGGTCGWFLYAGDYSTDDDFFQPQHARHVLHARPELGAYLGLPPGWGFVLAPSYEDVFQDDGILRHG